MSARVVFFTSGSDKPESFQEFGANREGAWGLVDDEPWLAGQVGADIELLCLSAEAYHHAMRGLAPKQIGQAVLRRRAVFSADVPGQALGEVALAASRCLVRLPEGPPAMDATSDLLTALATFTTVPRLVREPPLVLLDYLREGDAELVAELESPSLPTASAANAEGEREARRTFALALGAIAARHGQSGKERFLPHVDLARVCWVVPADAETEQQARFLGEPIRPWRGGILLPIPERSLDEVKARGHRVTVLFPARGPFLGALQECTPAQLEVELAERMSAPGFADFLNGLRLQQAILRMAVHMIAGQQAEIGPVLSAHTQAEAASLAGWLARNSTPASTSPDFVSELRTVIDSALLLAAICRHKQRIAIAGKMEALARALSHVAEEVRT